MQAQNDAGELYSVECVRDGKDVDSGEDEINNVEHEPEEWLKFWDDMSGKQLDSSRTKRARQDEIERINKMQVWEKVPTARCWERTGKRPVGTRWVDVDKGDQDHPNHRSRLVAQEIKTNAQPELFSATPPLEYVKYLLSRCASRQRKRRGDRGKSKIMIQDVKNAYFYAPAKR